MIDILINAFKIISLLALVIFIHECGHFFVAKWCKVKVKEFAIGFGPTIWQKQGKETKYALRLFPLGGYVNMLGEEEHSDEEGSFSKLSVYKRIPILLAGAVFNVIFGLIIYFVITTTAINHVTTVIEEVTEGYAASEFGLEVGDEIVRIDGRRVRFGLNAAIMIAESEGRELDLTIRRNGELEEISVKPTRGEYREIRSAFIRDYW